MPRGGRRPGAGRKPLDAMALLTIGHAAKARLDAIAATARETALREGFAAFCDKARLRALERFAHLPRAEQRAWLERGPAVIWREMCPGKARPAEPLRGYRRTPELASLLGVVGDLARSHAPQRKQVRPPRRVYSKADCDAALAAVAAERGVSLRTVRQCLAMVRAFEKRAN